MSRFELAEGFMRVANANMARALRSISVAKGCDPADYLLVPIGGAAGQHACALAEELGMPSILFHPDAGLLSALGAGLADHVRHRSAGIYRLLEAISRDDLAARFGELEQRAVADLELDLPFERGIAARAILRRALELRYTGVEAALFIEEPPDGNYASAFEAEHVKIYGYAHAHRAIEAVSARVEAALPSATPLERSVELPGGQVPSRRRIMAYFDGALKETPVFYADDFAAGDRVAGPAVIVQRHSTVVLEADWHATVLSGDDILATRRANGSDGLSSDENSERAMPAGRLATVPKEPDPVQLEIFNNHFAGIAEQMGIALRNTAISVNVKERLDFSCAIFTAEGELVVNAPHIPVHLGAMGQTVRSIIADNLQIRPGDVFLTNDPYRGGSHLPDLTVVTPVFFGSTSSPIFFTASRAHHAEIGGITPGSMPAFSRNLAEEGVVIRNFKLIDAGDDRFEPLRQLLTTSPYPSRAVNDNLADLAAQVAANRQGAHQLLALVERFGAATVQAFMRFLQESAAQKMRRALAKLSPGRHTFEDYLDDGSPIRVTVCVAASSIEFDFSGTGPVLTTNFNANTAIARAAVMYVLRCLIDDEIPLNDGIMAAVRIHIPEGLLNPQPHSDPRDCAALAAGNVETSQRVVDALLGALKMAAASQGTMNNLLFGNQSFGYYETICGGAGATRDGPGADAVHTHMTNTRLTDPELLERRFPVRLWEFSIRENSGGAGVHRGGDGVIRRIEFLRPLAVSIVSQRRGPYAPSGLEGGRPGALGRNTLARASSAVEPLGAVAQFDARPGDVLTIETPGGGGWGRAATA
jgi:5-oxoprolinase (ATP-hydrolysing)